MGTFEKDFQNKLIDILSKEKEPYYFKIHFGRSKKVNSFIPPELFKGVESKYKITYIDTNTLYGGERNKTESHIALANRHGFKNARILKDSELLKMKGTIINIAHLTGHTIMAFGGCMKNIGMGLATAKEKLQCHGGGKQIKNNILPTDKFENQAFRLGQLAKKVETRLKIKHHMNVILDITKRCDCQGDTNNREILFSGNDFIYANTSYKADLDTWFKYSQFFTLYYKSVIFKRQLQGYNYV